MKKLIYILLVLMAILLLLPCLVYSQGTSMILDINVRRIPVNSVTAISCKEQRVLMHFNKDLFGLLTEDDTLSMRRISIIASEPGRSLVLSRDEFHDNQQYTVLYIESQSGIAIFITPVFPYCRSERKLFSIVLSSTRSCK